MAEEINGQKNDVKTAQEAANKAMNSLVTYMATPLHITMRGLVATAPQVRPELMLIAAAHAFAHCIGSMYGGSEEEIKKLREGCRVAFSGTLHQVPMVLNTPKVEEPAKVEEPVETFGKKEEAA